MTGLPLVAARGTRYEVGLAHGGQAGDLVRGTLEWSLEQLRIGSVEHGEARARAERLLPYIEGMLPDLLEECRGIADGAGLPLLDVLVINTRYELLFLTGSQAPRPGVAGAECSLIGVTGHRSETGAPMIAQNVDLGPESRPLWIALDAAPEGATRVLTVTMAGMLAQEGLNAEGLGLCGSMVRSRDWGAGLPTRKFLRRKVLEQRGVASAIDLIRSAPKRASSHNLLLADGDAVVDVETTASRVYVTEPFEGVIVHTNHYVHRDAEAENEGLGRYLANSVARHDRLAGRLVSLRGTIGVEAIKSMLSDHYGGSNAVCRHASADGYGAETNVAVIIEPSLRRMHVALGPPCESTFQTLELPTDSTAPVKQLISGGASA